MTKRKMVALPVECKQAQWEDKRDVPESVQPPTTQVILIQLYGAFWVAALLPLRIQGLLQQRPPHPLGAPPFHRMALHIA